MIWLDALHDNIKNGQACVLVTITDVVGSAPRTVGSRMLVNMNGAVDTIGGGALEQQAIDYSMGLLKSASPISIVEPRTSVLGAELSQCCGGKITLNYEYHPARKLNIVVFGAGHVAQSVAVLLRELACRVQFFDSRAEWLEKLPVSPVAQGVVSANTLGSNPFLTVEQCPDNAYFLVMTHSHELDFDLVEAILSRGDSAYCGLIASKSKAARFKTRLYRKGFTDSEIRKLTAPIGAQLRTGNLPMEVAIAAVSEILQLSNQNENTNQNTEMSAFLNTTGSL